MGTMQDAINKNKHTKNLAFIKMVAKHGVNYTKTDIGNWIKSGQKGTAYLYAQGKMVLVDYIKWPDTDPWAHCPRENAGYGLSYCVHYGMNLFVY